jgi:hypothetical protein
MAAIIRIDENNKVYAYHESPEKLTAEQKKGTIKVSSIPKMESTLEKAGWLEYNPNTKEVEVKYRDRTQEEIDRIKK